MAIPVVVDAPSGISAIAYFTTILEKNAPIFFLIVARIFGLTLQAPFFSAKSLPPQVRATLITSLAMMYMIVIKPEVKGIPDNMILYTVTMIQEILIGVAFGFCASIIVSAIQAAGEIMDVQMGMSMVMLFNPQTKSQSSAMGRLFYQIELTVFVFAHGHLYLLAAFFNTFEMVPIGKFNFSNPIVIGEYIQIVSKLFYVSLQLSLPILIVLFIVDFSLGITNKVSPQINVLELNFAMKPVTGMVILLILMSSLISMMAEYTSEKINDGVSIIKVMGKAVRIEDNRRKQNKYLNPPE